MSDNQDEQAPDAQKPWEIAVQILKSVHEHEKRPDIDGYGEDQLREIAEEHDWRLPELRPELNRLLEEGFLKGEQKMQGGFSDGDLANCRLTLRGMQALNLYPPDL